MNIKYKIMIALLLVATLISCDNSSKYNDTFEVEAVSGSTKKVIIKGLKDKTIKELFIPKTINHKTVVGIADNAFMNNQTITSVKFAKDSKVTSIGNQAFSDVANAENLELPSSLEKLGDYAFASFGMNKKITKALKIPDGCISFGNNVFATGGTPNRGFCGEIILPNNPSFTNLPSNLIGDKGTAFTKLKIPRSIKKIEAGTLGRNSLLELYIPKETKGSGKGDYFNPNQQNIKIYFEDTKENIKKTYGEKVGIPSSVDGKVTTLFEQTYPTK